MNEVYRLIGLVVNNSQVIEHNLAYGLSLHKVVSLFDKRNSVPVAEYNRIEKEAADIRKKMKEMTLGGVIKLVSETKCFEPKVLDKLEQVLADRNYVVHQMIKDRFQPTDQEVTEMRKYLKATVEDTNAVNKSLCDRIAALEKTYDGIE